MFDLVKIVQTNQLSDLEKIDKLQVYSPLPTLTLEIQSALYISTIVSDSCLVIEWLIQQGLRAHYPYREEKSPIHFAAQLGKLHILKLFAKKGISLNVKDPKTGFYPFHIAAGYGHIEMLEWLIKEQNIASSLIDACNLEFSVVHAAALKGQSALLEYFANHSDTSIREKITHLLWKKDKRGLCPIHYASGNGQTPIVKFLLKHSLKMQFLFDASIIKAIVYALNLAVKGKYLEIIIEIFKTLLVFPEKTLLFDTNQDILSTIKANLTSLYEDFGKELLSTFQNNQNTNETISYIITLDQWIILEKHLIAAKTSGIDLDLYPMGISMPHFIPMEKDELWTSTLKFFLNHSPKNFISAFIFYSKQNKAIDQLFFQLLNSNETSEVQKANYLLRSYASYGQLIGKMVIGDYFFHFSENDELMYVEQKTSETPKFDISKLGHYVLLISTFLSYGRNLFPKDTIKKLEVCVITFKDCAIWNIKKCTLDEKKHFYELLRLSNDRLKQFKCQLPSLLEAERILKKGVDSIPSFVELIFDTIVRLPLDYEYQIENESTTKMLIFNYLSSSEKFYINPLNNIKDTNESCLFPSLLHRDSILLEKFSYITNKRKSEALQEEHTTKRQRLEPISIS